jgi:hypothetical protein
MSIALLKVSDHKKNCRSCGHPDVWFRIPSPMAPLTRRSGQGRGGAGSGTISTNSRPGWQASAAALTREHGHICSPMGPTMHPDQNLEPLLTLAGQPADRPAAHRSIHGTPRVLTNTSEKTDSYTTVSAIQPNQHTVRVGHSGNGVHRRVPRSSHAASGHFIHRLSCSWVSDDCSYRRS